MITRFLTSVSTAFNPFSPRAKTVRNFLALLPPNARANGMKVDIKLLPQASQDAPKLKLGFKDGKEMDLDLEKLRLKELTEEVDRHSRILQRKDELTSG